MPMERAEPSAVGLDPAGIADALAIAEDPACEVTYPRRDIATGHAKLLARMPHGDIVGPLTDRTGPKSVIARGDRIVGTWGEIDRAETTFSVSKSFISTVAGIARREGLLGPLDEAVAERVDDPAFASERHRRITWRHLLQQTSEWDGTLFGKPVTSDRPGSDRELAEPGTVWEYNDVRVNLCAYALLRLLGRPLPDVIREAVLDTIGFSDTWRWHGYSTSEVDLDGRQVTSVAGGGHWGGGVVISAMDMARYGQLYLRDGTWNGARLLPEGWVDETTRPCPIHPTYGLLFWLNTDRELWPDCPPDAFAARGYGGNTIYVDRSNDLVVVTRWMSDDAITDVLGRVVAACERIRA